MAETFGWEPLYSWEATREHRVQISEFESGKEQRRYKGRKPRTWILSFQGTASMIAEIEAFYEARQGPFESFLWTPPGGASALTVRFDDSVFDAKRSGLGLASVSLTIREVI